MPITKTYDDYLFEAIVILAKKSDSSPKSYEYYLAEAAVEIEKEPHLKQEAEKRDAYLLVQNNQNNITTGKTFIEYLAEAKMIINESNREGSELSLLVQAENNLYDKHIETAIPMEQIITPELEKYFQKSRTTIIEKMEGCRQEAQSKIDLNRSRTKVRVLDR